MKRSIFAFLVLLGALAISIVSPLIYDHYVKGFNPLTGDTEEVVVTEEVTAQVSNPILYTVDDAVQFHEREVNKHITDSTFAAIPADAVKTIATVLIGRDHRATKQDIVNEFKAQYKNTYQYIVPPEQKGDTIKVSGPPDRDTVINGKHFVLIKEVAINELTDSWHPVHFLWSGAHRRTDWRCSERNR